VARIGASRGPSPPFAIGRRRCPDDLMPRLVEVDGGSGQPERSAKKYFRDPRQPVWQQHHHHDQGGHEQRDQHPDGVHEAATIHTWQRSSLGTGVDARAKELLSIRIMCSLIATSAPFSKRFVERRSVGIQGPG
jgi:hypothetical protein